MDPRVLVLSNECFSKNTSNGRTLGNFFLNWSKESLAQFYISGTPDTDYCTKYFHVSDRMAMRAIVGKIGGGEVSLDGVTSTQSTNGGAGKKTSRNALTMILRNAIWNSRRWQKAGYWKWVDNFSPDIVLLQAGDCPFMFNLAVKTARKCNAKFVIYNTEGYYFKNFDYFWSKGLYHLMYPLFSAKLKKAIRRAYLQADYSIFNCDALSNDFNKEFTLKSEVIYTATDANNSAQKRAGRDFRVTYAGNLGVGRPQSLVDIANALQEIAPQYFVDIYGTIPNEEANELFEQCSGIHFHGRISYEEVKKVIQDSDLLLHTEGFDPYYVVDLKYAFSTKIADCLASNRCFLMYAPKSFAETQYLKENQAAYIATSKEELKDTLRMLIDKPETRNKYCNSALQLAKKNHDGNSSVMRFQKILRELV